MKTAVMCVVVSVFLWVGVVRAGGPSYGQTVDETRWWSVSQPAGTPAADGYVQLRSDDTFIRKNKNGAFEFCMQHNPIPWWSGRLAHYCTKWGDVDEFVKKTAGPNAGYVGMGVSYSYLILFYRTTHEPCVNSGKTTYKGDVYIVSGADLNENTIKMGASQ